ncbi:unannotated protein [freshwater metagenome]|uniref:Unannotated protein n=1 Tax=freshwater metagenome TaxID=449393 RepID=A0A6J6LMK7_9ZZZZ
MAKSPCSTKAFSKKSGIADLIASLMTLGRPIRMLTIDAGVFPLRKPGTFIPADALA